MLLTNKGINAHFGKYQPEFKKETEVVVFASCFLIGRGIYIVLPTFRELSKLITHKNNHQQYYQTSLYPDPFQKQGKNNCQNGKYFQ